MKKNHLFFAFLVAATAWADSVQTYVFFENVNGTLKSLRADDADSAPHSFVRGDPLADPTEFLYQDGRARSSSESKPGNVVLNIQRGFTLTESETGAELILDTKGRLLNSFFFSCAAELPNSVISVKKANKNCVLSDIYFLPYDRTTKGPVKGSYIQEKDVERKPHVFFIESKEGLEPLYLNDPNPNDFVSHFFEHGSSTTTPVEFFVQNDYAMTELGGETSLYAAFSDTQFGVNIAYGNIRLGLDKSMTLSTSRFFSCADNISSGRVIVLDPFTRSECFEVDIHLLPYNRTSKGPEKGTFTPKKNKANSKSSSSLLDYPYVFFIKGTDTWEPLSYVEDKLSSHPGVFIHKTPADKPVEFSLKHNIAYTDDGSVQGFAGYMNDNLVFGGQTQQSPFDLDSDMKINDYPFFSCARDGSSTDRDILIDISPRDSCVQVPVYLKRYNRTSGQPVKELPVPEKEDETTKVPSESDVSTMAEHSESVSTIPHNPESVASMPHNPESGATPLDPTTSSVSKIVDVPKSLNPDMARPADFSGKTHASHEPLDLTRSKSASVVNSDLSENTDHSFEVNSDISKPFTSSMTRSSKSVLSKDKSSKTLVPKNPEHHEPLVPKIPEGHEPLVPKNPEGHESLVPTDPESRESSDVTISDNTKSSHSIVVEKARSSTIPDSLKSSEPTISMAEESTIGESSKWMATTLTRKTTSTATICAECKAASRITVLKTYTDYTTYCPEETTMTISVCNSECHPSTVTVTSATTLTCAGVCIFPEIITVTEGAPKEASETANVKHNASKDHDKHPSALKGGSVKEGDSTPKKIGKTIAKEGDAAKVAGQNPSTPHSPKETAEKYGSASKPGKENKSGKENETGKEYKSVKESQKGNENKSGKESQKGNENESGKESQKGKENKPEKKPKVSEQKSGNRHSTTTQTFTGSTKPPSAYSFDNAASRNSFGACVLGFAVLLL